MQHNIKHFDSKEKLFNFIKIKFSLRDQVILVRGSATYSNLKFYSDVDIEIYGEKKKPYYEIIFLNKRLILLNIYFYNLIKGKDMSPPANVKILHEFFNSKIEPDFSKDTYN